MATLVSRISDLAASIRDRINAMTPRLLPTGGTAGMVLSKIDGSDFAAQWINVNDVVDYDRITTMINDAIANGGTTNPGGGDDGGGDPGDGGTNPGIPGDLITTRWTANGLTSPIVPTGHFTTPLTLEAAADGTPATADDALLVLNTGTFLEAEGLAFGLATDSDDNKTQTPAVFRLGVKGKLDANYGTAVDVSEWANGQFTFSTSWTGTNLRVTYGRNGNGELIDSDDATLNFGTNELYEAEWRNDPSGAGGFMRFFVGGVQIGSEKPTSMKFRTTDNMELCVNATLGNTSGSVDGFEVEYVEISYQTA